MAAPEWLLTLSRSADWADRNEAAQQLGQALPDRAAFDRLVEMLDDENKAPIEFATHSLIAHGGPEGLRAVLTAYQTGPEDAAMPIGDEIWRMAADLPAVRDALRLAAVGEPGAASEAAAEIVASLKL